MPKLVHSLPLYEKLKQQLRDYIAAEQPKLLPGENELVSYYGISRNTVRRAIRDLTDEGLLRPVQGLGTLVNYNSNAAEQRYILVLVGNRLHDMTNQTFSMLMDALENYQLNALLAVAGEKPFRAGNIRYLLEKSEGIIIDQSLAYSEELHEMVKISGRPLVCLRCWEPRFIDENFVIEDVGEGFYQMTRHLLELGHRKIAVLCNPRDVLRMPSIERAFAEFGLAIDPGLAATVRHGYRLEGYRAAAELLGRKKKFSAVIAHNDSSALGIMERLLQAGLRIPEDVAITGADNLPEAVDYPVPLTTFGGNLNRMINEAISMLLAAPAQPQKKIFPVELQIRESTVKK